MVENIENSGLAELEKSLSGELLTDDLSRILYSTDASVYMQKPIAIAIPLTEKDLVSLVHYANKYRVPLIPRTAGTSLAGQVVGDGLVVDFSQMNKILHFDEIKNEITVQPGVVRDELNDFLKPYGLFFSPITSTANRAMMGGMVGNNSCGTNSIKYGSTRDKIVSVKAILYKGEICKIGPEDSNIIEDPQSSNCYDEIKNNIIELLSPEVIRQLIIKNYPKASIKRRNTGYALDYLINGQPFNAKGPKFNLAKVMAGSEGTLGLFSEITIKLDELPPKKGVVVAVHFDNLMDSFKGTQVAMKFEPFACEMMDKIILDCTKENIQQKSNRFFIRGDPQALILVEYRSSTNKECDRWADILENRLSEEGLGYAYTRIYDADIKKVWALRSSGLGVLSNIPGDEKAVACIEDTAVSVEDLPTYMEEFQKMMESFNQRAVYYAHAGAGEIHLRPLLNLKSRKGIEDFYEISKATATLVKKYGGSLSGEHGDGRVRAPFIPLVLGDEITELLQKFKNIWDPTNIFNPGKIVNPKPMDKDLRTYAGQETPEIQTMYDFSSEGGIIRFAEKCNGSGDCRKLPLSGGTMCPSYQATRNEKDTTRARANTLRSVLTSQKALGFHTKELTEVLSLCLSCKACTSECPSNVNMTMLKSEVLYQNGKHYGFTFRSKIFGQFGKYFKFGSYWPSLINFGMQAKLSQKMIKKVLGIAEDRSLPIIAKTSLKKWYKNNYKPNPANSKAVYLFMDEFTNYLEPEIGIKAIKLLNALGYNVLIKNHEESGRAAMSRGLLDYAKKVADRNIESFTQKGFGDLSIVGIEPSAILSFKDEYPNLVSPLLRENARKLSERVYLIEDFLYEEINNKRINTDLFDDQLRTIIYHGHCHQKSLSKEENALFLLAIPKNNHVKKLETGCCGMAGSFGYEKEHFEISKKIANIELVPAIEKAGEGVYVVASGTSCRHQIFDFTGRKALHPVEMLYECLL